ncbi:MAG: hypothetical protein K2P14_10530 [Anaeroplasmataceae bacterium]|nr:hypothetical protein [Anaeroplasmataceae bacterium]
MYATVHCDLVRRLNEKIKRAHLGGNGYCTNHTRILLKLDQKPENKDWTYE